MLKHSFADAFNSDFYSKVTPTAVSNPKLICWSDDCAKILDFSKSEGLTNLLAGNVVPDTILPIATRYGGHQFGTWAGQLGDGRAILLGDKNNLEIQIKGAGVTPYSRRGDGRAVLRSSLREYLCSEAMHYLGVPTTRALALIETGDKVTRDMFYDGNPEEEPGAICVRVAESFIRLGHFEIFSSENNKDAVQKLLDFVTKNYYPNLDLKSLYIEICKRSAKLAAEWIRVGFVHGVLNTDNTSILGLTIDYGPYGWLDVYDLDWTPNTTDASHKRYRFGLQPWILHWNLQKFAQALSVLGEDLNPLAEEFKTQFVIEFESMMAKKIGLKEYNQELVQDLDELLSAQETDMTLVYRALAELTESGEMISEPFYQPLSAENKNKWNAWLEKWRSVQKNQKLNAHSVKTLMNRTNPAFILRNYLSQQAYEEFIQGDDTLLRKLELAIKKPYETLFPELCVKRPEWARHKPGCATLSCSS